MKRRILLFLCLFLVTSFCFAEDTYDKYNVEYVGKNYEIDLDYYITSRTNYMIEQMKTIGIHVYKIGKLTNKEILLLEAALDEYTLEKDDVYEVFIGEFSSDPLKVLDIVVLITKVYKDGSYDYSYCPIGKTIH